MIFLFGGALRFYRIDSTAVWCDELLSIHLSDGHNFAVDHLPRDMMIRDVPDMMTLANAKPAWKVWGSLSDDVHPPLYYVTLRLWREGFGDSPTTIRSLSAILGTLATAAMFFSGRELSGTVAGLWVAGLNAFAANHIYFGQEARMYAMALLWVSLLLWLILRIDRLGFTWRRGAGLGLITLLSMLTLNLSAAVLLACAAFALIRLRGKARLGILASFAAAAVAFAIVWLPFLFGPAFRSKKPDWLLAEPAGHVMTTLKRVASWPMDHLGILLPNSEWFGYVFAAVYVLPLIFLRRRPAILLPWLACVSVVGLPMFADLARTTNMLMWSRYTVLLVPPLSLAIVAASWELMPGRRGVRYALPAAVLMFSALSLLPLYQKQRFDFRAYALFAEQASIRGDGRLILATAGNDRFNSVLLLAMQYYWATPPREIVFVEDVATVGSLPRDVVGDRIILAVGDQFADLSKLPHFEFTGRETWQLGVGSVQTLKRREPSTTITSFDRRE